MLLTFHGPRPRPQPAPAAPATAANSVAAALQQCRPHLLAAVGFSALANLLYLTPTLYMLQVYGRVIPTGGSMTLLLLSLVALAGLALLGTMEWLRSRLLVRAAARFDAALAGRAIDAILNRSEPGRAERAHQMREFDTLRQAIASPGIMAAMDAPWTPLFVIASFLLHPALGLLTLASGALLLALAWHNDRSTRAPLEQAARAAAVAYARQGHGFAHAGTLRALGMRRAMSQRMLAERHASGRLQAQASFAAAAHNSWIKFLRLALQSASLGVGALLVIDGSIAAGAMIAASLLMARALAPVEQMVGGWHTLVEARRAYHELARMIGPEEASRTLLPPPEGSVRAEGLTIFTPTGDQVAVDGISFRIAPGEMIAVVGPSGAGKSTLLRALAGATLPARGSIRFDGASLADWDAERLAHHIGYLPHDSVLFPGTVKENIARFSNGDVDAAVVDAARVAGAHEMIVRLPQGYDTLLGPGGAGLSAGQAQRIALARALFGNPRILILDEPNAHLDSEASRALIDTLARLREQGRTIIVAAHANELVAAADKLMLLQRGRLIRFEELPDELQPARIGARRRSLA